LAVFTLSRCNTSLSQAAWWTFLPLRHCDGVDPPIGVLIVHSFQVVDMDFISDTMKALNLTQDNLPAGVPPLLPNDAIFRWAMLGRLCP